MVLLFPELNIFEEIALIVGIILTLIGVFCDVVGSIGMVRFPNFFVRLHAATVGTIGGAVYPLFGVTLMSLALNYLGVIRYFVATGAFLTAIAIVLTAPVGSHALARAAHRSKTVPVEPRVCDFLREDERLIEE